MALKTWVRPSSLVDLNTNKLITMMIDMEATCIACTPSYLLHVYDVLKERDLLDKIKLKTATR